MTKEGRSPIIDTVSFHHSRQRLLNSAYITPDISLLCFSTTQKSDAYDNIPETESHQTIRHIRLHHTYPIAIVEAHQTFTIQGFLQLDRLSAERAETNFRSHKM